MGSKTWTVGLIGVILWLIVSYTSFQEKQQLLQNIVELRQNNAKLTNILGQVFQEDFDLTRLKIDAVTVSSYSSDYNQCDSEPYITSSGSTVSPGCIATSRDLPIAKNKHILAVGIGTLRNEDTMHKRHNKSLDVWLPDKKAAKAFGIRKNVTIMWLE